ncbi:MAG TPA: hypothetical protein VF412_16855 [Bdellovibrio sp.]|uniref:hypothetical protein n=1 Tax=Bdellovibrio sp. TaxID=28201 RepID=UPI002EE3D51E
MDRLFSFKPTVPEVKSEHFNATLGLITFLFEVGFIFEPNSRLPHTYLKGDKMKKCALIILPLLIASCALLQTKIDSEATNTAPGFEYKYPKTGDWILGSAKPGNVIIGKKTGGDDTSILATIKYGPIGLTNSELEELKKTGKIKAHSAEEIISSFKKNIEMDAKQGRVKNIKTKFEETKYDKGSCLTFSQTGEDNGKMPISNDGKWCFNSKAYSYIMLNMSARVPEGKRLPDLTLEKAEFFNSLVFTEK